MVSAESDKRITEYLSRRINFTGIKANKAKLDVTRSRMARAFDSLPSDVLSLFLDGSRNLEIRVIPDPKLPFGMKTRSAVSSRALIYTLTVCDEAQDWSEDHFLGSFFRELGHVVAMLPPEDEWPLDRGERARFREHAECKADAMVWRWGLRHYDTIFLSATYPSHWVDKIVNDISLMLLSNNQCE
ncbi:MAG: hypothetical protein NTY51_11475 [Deltaproteobacteria bacterium]|nr:hypothetical protein [Deltaproteobacteria bacterium]